MDVRSIAYDKHPANNNTTTSSNNNNNNTHTRHQEVATASRGDPPPPPQGSVELTTPNTSQSRAISMPHGAALPADSDSDSSFAGPARGRRQRRA